MYICARHGWNGECECPSCRGAQAKSGLPDLGWMKSKSATKRQATQDPLGTAEKLSQALAELREAREALNIGVTGLVDYDFRGIKGLGTVQVKALQDAITRIDKFLGEKK